MYSIPSLKIVPKSASDATKLRTVSPRAGQGWGRREGAERAAPPPPRKCITNWALPWETPLVADLFLFCYERDFMKSLSRENQADIIEAFNSTSRYLDDLLNIDNIYFDQMVDRIYPTELKLNRTNSSDTEAPFLDLNLCISNGIVSTKIYDKRDDFDFDIVNFPFLDDDVPRRTSYGVYISQHKIRQSFFKS